MEKINIDNNAPLLYKLKILQDSINELLEELNKKDIISMEEDNNGS